MTHPSSLDLEAFVVGEPLPAAFAGHIDECAACSAFVAELGALAAEAPSRTAEQADAAVARALARASANDSMAEERAFTPRAPRAAQASNVSRIGSAAPRAETGASRRKLWMLASSVAAPLAAAAAILLFLSSSSSSITAPGAGPPPSVPATAAPPDRVLMGTIPGATEPDTQFKGGMQVAVVRERAGQQARFASVVRVRPGDRLRVEVALDREQAILAAVLADDGSYLEVMPLGVRGPGTHFSERSAKVDANGGRPTRGTILIGTAEAVARARTSKQLDGVTTVRVESEEP